MAFVIGMVLFALVIGLLDRALPWPRSRGAEDAR